jgi:hypothetical protein
MRATYTRTAGVRHLFAAYELGEDKLFGHIKPRKIRIRFLEFCRYLRSLYPVTTRIAIMCDNFSPHLSTREDRRVGTWAKAQRRDRLHAGQFVLGKPHRGTVHGCSENDRWHREQEDPQGALVMSAHDESHQLPEPNAVRDSSGSASRPERDYLQ